MVSFSKGSLFALLLARHYSLAAFAPNADEVISSQNGNDKKRQILQEDEGYWDRFVMEVNDMSLPSAEPSPAPSPAPSNSPTPMGRCLVLVSPLERQRNLLDLDHSHSILFVNCLPFLG
jgi:hypothetical protein